MARSAFEDKVAQLAVLDDKNTCWEIHPYTARWMYYDGLQWVPGAPPGRQSSVVPLISSMNPTDTLSALSPQALTTPDTPTPSRKSSASRPEMTWRRSSAQQVAPRALRRQINASNRSWVSFAVVAVLLLLAACLIFFGGQFALSGLAPQAQTTPTRVVHLATPTIIPTIVRQLTLPPTAPPLPVIGKIIELRVNVRAEPNTSARIIGKVIRDEAITLIGRTEDGAWYQVRLSDITESSWIYGATMEIASGDTNTLPIVK